MRPQSVKVSNLLTRSAILLSLALGPLLRFTAVSEANLAALMLLTSNYLFSCLMKIQKFGLTPIVVGNFEWQLSQWLFVLIGSLTYLKQNKKILLYQTQRFGGWNEV